MKRRVAPRKERADASRVRASLQRLEVRAMLSASYDSMEYRYGGQDFGQLIEAGSQFGGSAAVASQQQRSMSYETPECFDGHEFGGSYRALQNGPPMTMAFQPPPRPRSFDDRPLQNSTWDPSYASSPSPYGYSSYSEPEYYSYRDPQPTYVVWHYYIVSATPKVQDVQHFEPTISSNDVAQQRLQAKAPPTDFVASINAGNKATSRYPYQTPPASLDTVRNTIPSSVGILGASATITDVPSVSQIVSRETSTVATLSAVAREVAFQEFSPTLFQPNAVSAYDRANLDGLGADSTEPEMLDGFIRPADEAIVNATTNSSDAVAREREAVDAVLDELHDLDTLPPTNASTDITLQVDQQVDMALDEMPAGEVDGGMVLLQSTGDANGSGFDLTPVYANQPERFAASAKMETSVGMFQAVDVVTDDAPITDLAPQTESTSKPKSEIKLDDNLQARRRQSPNKAAAVAGATTLTGALVWLNRSGRRISHSEAAAQKRRFVWR